MKNSRMKICTLLLLAGFTITGCGDKLTTLTLDQENLVVSYSAHVVSKYNKNQTDGVTYIKNAATETSQVNQHQQPKDSVNKSDLTTTSEHMQTSNNDTQTQNQSTSMTQDMSKNETSTQTLPEEKTLTDALAIPSVTANIASYGIESQIMDQSFTFDLSPEKGMKSMVLHVDLTNQGSSDVQCDLLSSNVQFQLMVNHTLTVESEKSSLQSDLSAYNQTIKAGDVNHAVLIFSIPQDTDVSALALIVKSNNVSSTTNIL